MKNKILGAFGALALVLTITAGAYAAWGPFVYNWPNASSITGTLNVSQSFAPGFVVNAGVAAGTTPIDWSAGNTQRVLMPAGNTTFTFTNLWPGEHFTLAIQQDGTGSRTVTWPTTPAIKWTGGSAPTLTTAANKTDVFSFFYDSNGNVYETAVELNE